MGPNGNLHRNGSVISSLAVLLVQFKSTGGVGLHGVGLIMFWHTVEKLLHIKSYT